MSASIQNQSLAQGLPSYQGALTDNRFSSYVSKQSISAYESLDAGLTIKTREGDVVTLSSSSYSQLDAYMYNSKGILENGSGKVAVQQQREITLASGESFTFSVSGDLNEAELKDIDALVKGLDGVISEITRGSMDDAINAALSMGTYGSIETYSADIKYEKSYSVASEFQGQRSADQPNASSKPLEKPDASFEKLSEFIEKLNEKLADNARKPVAKLFRHHLDALRGKDSEKEDSPVYRRVDYAGRKIDRMLDRRAIPFMI